MEDRKSAEYLALRDEVQRNLAAQKEWSIFTITITVTILGFAINAEDGYSAELCLLPFIILVTAATKMRNYKSSISKIVAYMMVRHESPDGFFWETCLNKYRAKQSKFVSIIGVLETQEFFLTGLLCMLLSIHYSAGQCELFGINKIVIYFLACILLLYIILVTQNYWNMEPTEVEDEYEKWKSIIGEGNDQKSK